MFMRKSQTLQQHLLGLMTAFCVLTALSGCSGQARGEGPVYDTIPHLVMQIQKCSRLYTTEYRVRKIVTANDEMRFSGSIFSQEFDINLPLGERKVAVPVVATLKGYIDFEDFGEQNVSRRDGRIIITLPNPRVALTSSKIDHEGMREYVSMFRQNFSDNELAALERQGRDAIVAGVPDMGIVEMARDNAANLLIPIIAQMGYRQQDITIVFSSDFDKTDTGKLIDTNTSTYDPTKQ